MVPIRSNVFFCIPLKLVVRISKVPLLSTMAEYTLSESFVSSSGTSSNSTSILENGKKLVRKILTCT